MITKYNNIKDPTPIPISITDYINEVKNGANKPEILTYQNATKLNKQQRTELKNAIPCVTISNCNGKHSGYITIDFDTNIDRTALIADKYSYVVAKSVGGINNFCIVKIDGSKHTESFNALQYHYYNTYNALINQGCAEVSFKRFISYDADIYTNDKATVFKPKALKPIKYKEYKVILSNIDFDALICKLSTNTAPLQQYIDIFGNAMAYTHGEVGRDNFNKLFNNDTAYTYYLRTCDGSITLGALYHICRDFGVKMECTSLVTTPIQSNVVVPKVHGTKLHKVVNFFNENYNFAYNMITMQIEDRNVNINGKPLILEDNNYNTILLNVQQYNEEAKFTKDFLTTVMFSDYVYAYNPILEFFEQNKNYKRDGTTIQRLADSIETTTKNHQMFIKHWLVGLISGALKEASPLMLILAGEKINTGKTKWFRNLLPTALQSLYAENKLDSGKTDDDILMCKKLIIMDDEMSGTSKKENKRIKALMSKDTFSIRVPYGRISKDMRRISTQCATTNDKEILSDPTGNRRLLPIHVLSIYFDVYNSINKTALLMDAYDLYTSGWKWELSQREIDILNASTEEFLSTNYERELVMACFELPSGLLTEYLTNTEIKAHIENATNQRIFDVRKLGMELKFLGFEQKTIRINNFPAKRYAVKKVTAINNFTQDENKTQDEVPF